MSWTPVEMHLALEDVAHLVDALRGAQPRPATHDELLALVAGDVSAETLDVLRCLDAEQVGVLVQMAREVPLFGGDTYADQLAEAHLWDGGHGRGEAAAAPDADGEKR